MSPSLIFLTLIITTAFVLLVPVRLKMRLLKDASMIRGFYRIAWFGMTLKEGEISHPGLVEPMDEARPARPKEKRKIMVPIAEAVAEEKEKDLVQKGGAGDEDKSTVGMVPGPKEIDAVLDALPVFLETAGGILRTIQVEECSLYLILGTGDAADTARIIGYIWSAAAVALSILPRKVRFDLDPYFLGERMDGSAIVDISVRPLLVGLASVKALKEKQMRDLIMTAARDA